MRIATQLDYSKGWRASVEQAVALEAAGLDSIWVAEVYGFDAVSLMGYLAARTETVEIGSAIIPIYSRTPALIAMTAAGLDALTEGRFHLGLGASGPQVIEGWHGVPYTAPVTRTRETIEVCRAIWRRERVTYDGRTITLPLPEDQGTGLGKPLKLITEPVREHIPIWVASLGPSNVQMTAEVADGWIPTLFIPERADDVWGEPLAKGRAARSPDLGDLRILAGGLTAVGEGEDVRAMRDLARHLIALYVGGMGSRDQNFYNDLVSRYGYEQEAARVQNLYLDGKKHEAAEALPAELVEALTLCGPEGYVRDRLAAYEAAGVTDLLVLPAPVGDQTPQDVIRTVRSLAG
ncbi:MAG TPA: LLM class F420-dependent oxidoreductase [Nitriliruptorales bacterium]